MDNRRPEQTLLSEQEPRTEENTRFKRTLRSACNVRSGCNTRPLQEESRGADGYTEDLNPTLDPSSATDIRPQARRSNRIRRKNTLLKDYVL